MGTTSFEQPVAQGDQIPCHCPKALQFFLALSPLNPAETSHHEVIVDVNPTTAWIKNFHGVSSSASFFLLSTFLEDPLRGAISPYFLLRASPRERQRVVHPGTLGHLNDNKL